jgi:hypothetical protein
MRAARPILTTLRSFLLVVGLAAAAPAAAQADGCVGDCSADGEVTVDEIITGVNIALGTQTAAACPAFDGNGDGEVTVDEIVTSVNNALNGCPVPAPTPVFPADYRDSYVEVRDCRFSIEHGGVSIRVLANDIGAAAYLANANPLPVGSIVVKEEFFGPDCDDADLARWRVMRKESPGFDSEDGDWAWQWVDPDRSVRFNDKTTCIGCHDVPSCNVRDKMCTEGPRESSTWRFVLEELDSALLSITGTSVDDVYAVGADPGDGFGPMFLNYDGNRWQRYDTGADGDLWWISVHPVDGRYFLSGTEGLLLEYDIASGQFTRHTGPGTSPTMYGIWAAAADDVWAVGGDPADAQVGGVIWHYDGSTWTEVDTTGIREGGLPTLFKVWGRSATEIYAVGFGGVALRYDGAAWQQIPSGTTRTLFTVHGNDQFAAASGGFIDGVIVEDDGSGFVQRNPPATEQMNGMFIAPDGRGLAVGVAGSATLRSEFGWEVQDTDLATPLDFHAGWIDPEGGLWAVGGDLTTLLDRGMVAYSGRRQIGNQYVDVDRCPPGALLPGATVSYVGDIVPLLEQAGCASLACHGGPFPSSGYSVASYDGLFGPAVQANLFGVCNIVPGDPDASYLIEKLHPSPRFGQQMPSLRPPLAAGDIELIRTWILEGAGDDSPPTVTPTPTRTVPPTATRTPTQQSPPTATSGPPPTLAAVCDEPGTVCTVAGTGLARFDGDGPALSRSFYFPIDITFDSQGRPLVMDWNNLRLRRVNADGSLETVMGLDFEDFPTDGALAKDTPLHHASDIEFDANGNLFVAGDHVPVVFRVGINDRVFTVAGTSEYGYAGDGGSALKARLSTPFGVLPDDEGGLYIADVDAHVIRHVRSNGIIETVAGTGERGYSGDGGPATAAKLAGPARMQLDADGNLYFCETKSHVVRKVDTSGVIHTIAGTGVRGYSGDGGPATAAELDTPYDIRFAPDGDLYIADTGNHVIRRIDARGRIATVVGTGSPGFSGDGRPSDVCVLNRPSAIEFGPDGSLWICDTMNHRVRRIAGFLGNLSP